MAGGLKKRLAVVVPAFCEMRLLPETVRSMPDYVDHIVVVDDGSPDGTFEVATQLSREDARVDVIRLGFNRGVGHAITRGYKRALELEADVVAVMAADNQMDPQDLREVIAPVVEESADYTKGNRLAHPESQRMPFLRRMGTSLLARMTGLICGMPQLCDSQCGYTAISAEALERVPLDELYPRYGYPNDLLLRLSEVGARVEQPVVRPVYASEQSGLRIPAVILPISGILFRGAVRRILSRIDA